MNNRFLRYLLFLLILIVSDQVIGRVISSLAKKQVRDNRIGLLLDGKTEADIAIIGSSRALNNYSPAIISKQTGMSCYNYGVSGSNVLFHETMLDLILQQKHKPKIVIYNLDDRGVLFAVDNIIYRKDVLYPYVDNSLINKKVCELLNKKYFATFICKTYLQNVNFINAAKFLVYGRENPDYKTTNFDDTGADILVMRKEDPVPMYIHKNYDLVSMKQDTGYVAAFKRIQEKCKANDVKLILSLPPLYAKNTIGFKELIQSNISSQVELWDFRSTMQDSSYFFNADHMNNRGAELFSEAVAGKLKKLN